MAEHEGRVTAELTVLVGSRVVGEHRHPAMVECFTVVEGELTLKPTGRRASCAKARRRSSTRVFGTTGGMRVAAMPASEWKSRPASALST
jgi:hypothetical protein